jgi:sulfur-oxidizing protein SoxX
MLFGFAVAIVASGALAQDVKVTPEMVEAAVAKAWANAAPELKGRVAQDDTMRLCSLGRNNVDKAVAEKIVAEAKKSVVYPEGGKLIGDWKKGERSAQSGYGLRMGDSPNRATGGNCYACHQLDPKEVSYGTLGPSLKGYGKIKGNTPQSQKETYEKIFNPHVMLACSTMPRFGANKVLNPADIADLVALLLDPASPVNQE